MKNEYVCVCVCVCVCACACACVLMVYYQPAHTGTDLTKPSGGCFLQAG